MPAGLTFTPGFEIIIQIGEMVAAQTNLLHNGTFDIWQRGISALASAATTVNGYQADGWITNNTFSSGAGPVMSQVVNNRTNAQCLYGLKILGAANCSDVKLIRRIESYIAARAESLQVTFQAWVYNNTGGSITPTIAAEYAGSQDVWTSPSSDLAAANLQVCTNGAWTQVAYAWTVSASAVNGYELILDFGNNFSANTKYIIVAEACLQVTSGATGQISTPPTPDFRLIAGELAFCQRYFWRNGPTTQYASIGTGFIITTTSASFYTPYPTTMRAVPTISVSGTAVFGIAGPTPVIVAVATLGTDYIGNASALMQPTFASTAYTPGSAANWILNSTTDYLQGSSEL